MSTEVNVNKGIGASTIIVFVLILALLGAGLAFTYSNYREAKISLKTANDDKVTLLEELKGLKGGNALLGDSLKILKTRNEAQAYKIKSLTLTKEQLERYSAEDAETISNLKIKLKDVQSVSTANISNQVTANTSLEWQKDSTWSFNTCLDKDTLNDVFGVVSGIPKLAVKNVKIEVNSVSKASLTIINYQEQRRFLFWKWLKSTEDFAITTNNPSMTIESFRVVKVTK